MRWLFFIVLCATGLGCSVEQNTFTANMFHNMTAHFNGYFYAREKFLEVEKRFLKELDDDPSGILQLYPRLDTSKAKSYKQDTDEIIKMASISIQRHPNSRWTDDNYLLVGIARMYSRDFLNAMQTFKYVNTKSKDSAVRHRALLYLLRTFADQEDDERAVEAMEYLDRENLNRENLKQLWLEKAHYFQIKKSYEKMVYCLTKANPLLTKRDRQARICFITGQVYQKLGFDEEAFIFYRKALAANPDYEIDFYARLNMAQVAQVANPEAVSLVEKQFQRLLKDSKNIDFIDKIYYELGWFEQKQSHFPEAIENYTIAAGLKKNQRVQGMSYLRIGDIYFDSLRKYDKAQPYYDSALKLLSNGFENYDAMKKRTRILDEFVKYSSRLNENDSLLALAKLDTATIRKRLAATLAQRQIAKQKKPSAGKRKHLVIPKDYSSAPPTISGSGENSDWYFDNPSAVVQGEFEFQRTWGSISLEDNWRRSSKNVVINADNPAPSANDAVAEDKQVASPAAALPDAVSTFMQKIPFAESSQKKLLQEIEEAYFKLGDLYFFDLNERDQAAQSLENLLKRFPESELIPETLFKLHRIYVDKDPAKSKDYAQQLITRYPKTPFARSLVNPNYWKEDLIAANNQRNLYKAAFEAYQANELETARQKIAEGLSIGETVFRPQLEFLSVLIDARSEDFAVYQKNLTEWISKYPQESNVAYAKKLLQISQKTKEKLKDVKTMAYTFQPSEEHFFVLVHPEADRLTYSIDKSIREYNKQHFPHQKFTIVHEGINTGYITTSLNAFAGASESLTYLRKAYLSHLNKKPPFSKHKIYNFVISKSNFDILRKTKMLDDYLTFYDHTYAK